MNNPRKSAWLVVEGVPKAQARAGAVSRGRRGVGFYPRNQDVVAWRERIRQSYVDRALPHFGKDPIRLELSFHFPRPDRLVKPSIPPNECIRHTVKPDIDNLAKAIMDALNGVAWKDDAQVCEVHWYKWFGVFEAEPKVFIEVIPC